MAAVAEAASYFQGLQKFVLFLNCFPDCNEELLDQNPTSLRHKLILFNVSVVEKAMDKKLEEEPMEGFERKFTWERE
jgi:hypothetical protein